MKISNEVSLGHLVVEGRHSYCTSMDGMRNKSALECMTLVRDLRAMLVVSSVL